MKKVALFLVIGLLFIAAFPLSSVAEAEEIKWYSYEEGMQKAKSEGKPIFIDFWSQSCGPCVEMENKVYPDEDVIEKSSDFINIKVDAYAERQLSTEYNIESIPTLIFLNSDGEEIKRVRGLVYSSELINTMDEVLNSISNDNSDDQSVSNDVSSQDEPFWQSLIFLEIVVSVFIAAGIILFIRKTKEEEGV